MSDWENVTENFSKSERHYKKNYLEISEVLNDKVEVSLFSSETEPYEIYVSYGGMDGIIYSDKNQAYKLREKVKLEIEAEYQKHKKATSEFIKYFSEKYHLQLPFDLYFDRIVCFQV